MRLTVETNLGETIPCQSSLIVDVVETEAFLIVLETLEFIIVHPTQFINHLWLDVLPIHRAAETVSPSVSPGTKGRRGRLMEKSIPWETASINCGTLALPFQLP